MIPTKYKFYTCKVNSNINFMSNTGISDTGDFIQLDGAYSVKATKLNSGESVLFNFVPQSEYNAVFFYDDSMALILKVSLSKLNGIPAAAPPDAAYWAARFTSEDPSFVEKENTDFIYTTKRANPHYKELNKKYAKENGQEFFRISLDGKIELFGHDYEFVKQSNLEDEFVFIIYKYSQDEKLWVEYYRGTFNKTDCILDYDRKRCEPKITTIDSYTQVINKYENTYDLIKLAPEISKIDLHKRSLMQVYVRGSNSITNFFGGTYWEDEVNKVVDSHEDLVRKYYFSYIKAGNEFYVKNAKIAEVNGVYAGTSGYWSQWNGYTCYMGTEEPLEYAYIYIKRNSDGEILYRSEKQWRFLEAGNCYLEREDIAMVNVNDPSDKFTIESPFVYHIYRRLLCDVDSVEDSEGVKNTYNLPTDDFVTDNRNYKKCIGLLGGTFFCTSRTVSEPTKYGLNDYGEYFTNQFIPPSVGLGRPLPISRNSWANASLWYVYDSYYEYFEERLRKRYTLKNSYSIASAIKVLLKEIDPSIEHEATAEYSRFLYDESVPIFMDRFYVYITQKTNILKGEYDQPAQKAEISLKEITEMLRNCFRCYWYIEDNKFKIEHVSFFINGGSYISNENAQLDFTRLKDQFNKKLVSYFQSEVEYDKSELNARYEFEWMDDATELFEGIYIDVDSKYIQEDKSEEISVNKFSSDVDFMLFNPSSFSEDGFALLCPVLNNGLLELPITKVERLVDENGNEYSALAQNWFASWLYLVKFYMYDMPSIYIKYNAISELQVYSIKTCMEQSIQFPSEDDPDLFRPIKTSIGNGKIGEISVDIDTRQVTIKLLYRPE